MSSRDFDFLTLRNLNAYNADGSYVSTNYVLTTSSFGKGKWTNNLTLNNITLSTLNTSSIVANTVQVSTIIDSTGTAGISGQILTTYNNNTVWSSIYTGSVPNGTNWADYLYWDDTLNQWQVSTDRVRLLQSAGKNGQQQFAIAIGSGAGFNSQFQSAIAIGTNAGSTLQHTDCIAIGSNAGQSNQFGSVAIGSQAGQEDQGLNSIAIGIQAGNIGQLGQSIAIGASAGALTQGLNATAIGLGAGFQNQLTSAIAIGFNAGNIEQSTAAIAIGASAGQSNQSNYSIAIGSLAGQITQGQNAIAIGRNAGKSNQGDYAVAIGYKAGETTHSTNTIVINAQSNALQGTLSSACYIAPIRSTMNSNVLQYNFGTKEVTYNPNIQVSSISTLTIYDTNGSPGTYGQVLGSYGDNVYWSTISPASNVGTFMISTITLSTDSNPLNPYPSSILISSFVPNGVYSINTRVQYGIPGAGTNYGFITSYIRDINTGVDFFTIFNNYNNGVKQFELDANTTIFIPTSTVVDLRLDYSNTAISGADNMILIYYSSVVTRIS